SEIARGTRDRSKESSMGLREQLMDDLKDAMRSQDERRKLAIRAVMASIKHAETELTESGERVSLDDKGIQDIIARQVKQRRDSNDQFRKGGREDLVALEEAELVVLSAYLPREMSRAEIEAEARQT